MRLMQLIYGSTPFGFDQATLQVLPNRIFNTTPNGTTGQFGAAADEGGIWMGGGGLAVDSNTNLYFTTGDGNFNAYSGLRTEVLLYRTRPKYYPLTNELDLYAANCRCSPIIGRVQEQNTIWKCSSTQDVSFLDLLLIRLGF